MSGFSNLIDISSFFIGILINLLLVALMCYYFKRKTDNLEVAQAEQAKMLYSLISQQNHKLVEVDNAQNADMNSMGMLQNLNLDQLSSDFNGYDQTDNFVQSGENVMGLMTAEHDDGESDSNSDSESESDINDDGDSEIETEDNNEDIDNDDDTLPMGQENDEEPEVEIVNEKDVKSIKYNIEKDLNQLYDYEKMTVKELKSVADTMGIKNIKKYVKKQDLINILVSQSNNMEQIDFVKNKSDDEIEEIVDVEEVVEEPIVVHQDEDEDDDVLIELVTENGEDINIE